MVAEFAAPGQVPSPRVTGQLIDTASATHIWAERYERALDDIFALQDEITMSVTGAIEPTLRKAEIDRVRRKRPDSLDAYDLYLRALPYAFTAMPENADRALALLGRVTEAKAVVERLLELQPGITTGTAILSARHSDPKKIEALRNALRRAGLPE